MLPVTPGGVQIEFTNTTDSDFDGLSDAYEQWVTNGNPLSPDSDTDGIQTAEKMRISTADQIASITSDWIAR